jgi:hypothetical protein
MSMSKDPSLHYCIVGAKQPTRKSRIVNHGTISTRTVLAGGHNGLRGLPLDPGFMGTHARLTVV